MAHVVINDTTPRATFAVGATPTSGPFVLTADFVVFDPSTDIEVFNGTTLLTYSATPVNATQWSFAGTLIDGGYQGGSISLGGTVSSTTIVVNRKVKIARSNDFPFPSATLDIKGLNTALDKLFAIEQDTKLRNQFALSQPSSDAAIIGQLPAKSVRASNFLGFDAAGDPTTLTAVGTAPAVASTYLKRNAANTAFDTKTPAAVATDIGISAYGATLVDDVDAATARATLASAGTAANTFTGRQTLSGSAIDEAQGTAIASAATTDIGAVNGNFVHITGTTTITSLGSIQAGTRRIVTFDGTLKLTHGAVNLILPNGADITTAPGDVACFVSEGSGNWRCVWYQKANVRDSFTAHKSANQTGIASAIWTKITFDTEDWDVGGNYDAVNSKFLPITKGKYLIGATLHFSAGTVDQTAFLVAVYKNGVLLPQGIFVKMEASGTGTLIGGGSMIVDANGTTDYFEIFFNGEGVGTKTVDTLSTFWGFAL